MDKRSIILVLASLVMLGTASYFLAGFFSADLGVSERAYFYDLSAGKLFAAPRNSIPPIKGIDDSAEDGVRAVVISTSGNPKDKGSRRIAYLEKYSADLKREMEAARATDSALTMGRSAAQAHRFVKHPEDKDWFPLASMEGERIVTEWAAPGTNGVTPIVCSP